MLDADVAAHPNDAYFKAVFSVPENAAAFFQRHLPTETAALLDWPSLAPLPGSFVKGSLQQAHSDLVFSVMAGQRDVRLYLLFEHQTSVDPAMPLRLLAYITELLLAHEKQHGLPLPPVLPFVLHQGPDKWTVSTVFSDLFNLPEDLKAALCPFLPEFHHGLLDLTQFNPADEKDEGPLRIVLQLMKLARQKRLLDFFDWLAQEFVSQIADSLLRTSLVYAFNVDSSLDLEEIARRMESNRTLRTQTMSIAQKLIAQGREEGREEGYGQGVLKTCLRQARKKWGILLNETVTGIESLSYSQLEQLSEDLLDLGTEAELQQWMKTQA
ncbi:putative transposase/invertase (TIGR01784 family) [Prosthecobacter fusiformis]|uniref:Putative transposase/invertase (TIGR01784 family) n=2 Tax=Prosthecobacter fusiformis TaxID=48464 RepID=A0A4R7RMD2_9BACT|nr:putative transposase/invertase (TIGR01784 family) [Prosthecobacter fusiformis]